MADPYGDVTGSLLEIPTESPRDSKWKIHTVTCRFFRQNSWRTHQLIISSVKPSEKVNKCPLYRPSPPLFLLLLPNPNSPHLQTTTPPPPPKQKSPSSQHNKLYFLKVLWSQHPYSDLPTDFINFCK